MPRWPRPPWWATRTTIKGQGIYCYVTLMNDESPSDELARSCADLGPQGNRPHRQARPIQWAPGLPKTRSGKIMRRILRKIAENDFGALGDTSTLADPVRGRRPDRKPPRP
jgi:acetyl-CoA synthetase